MWMYRSLVEQQAHANAGLFGPLIVTRAGAADPATAKPKDIDAEFVTILQASLPPQSANGIDGGNLSNAPLTTVAPSGSN